MSFKSKAERHSAAEVKAAASGRWPDILPAVAGISTQLLDGNGHPCPKCGGTDRFSFIDETAGAVLCRKCFSKQNGDGLAAVAWMCGCDFPDAIKKVAGFLGLSPTATNGKPRIVDTYDYRDEGQEMVFQVVRYDPKDFRQRCLKDGGGWDWKVKGVRVVPYRLPELLADSKRPVIVVEGEKDVESLMRVGVVATCNAGGAGKWTAEHAQFLRGRRVIILPDNDDAGRNHAQQVAQSLIGIAASARIVELPNLPLKGDVSDWFAAGGTKGQLIELAKATSIWTPSAVPQPWSEIMSFEMLDLPEFPSHVLPPVLRDWIEAESHATQTPPDLAALLGLGVLSATIARRLVVEPRSGFQEAANLYTLVLLAPANRKSAVFKDATAPLREIEAELIEDARPSVARDQSDRRQAEARLKNLEHKAAKDNDATSRADARHQASELAAELAQQDVPVLPRLIADDVTDQKLGMMLAEQGGRLATMSPEGGIFDLMAGAHSKSGIAQFDAFLKGHAGDDLITDRVGRPGVRVPCPAVTCAYAIQPEVIKGLVGKSAFRGRGLLGRFLYSMPRSLIGQRQIAPRPVPAEIVEAYHQRVRTLFSSCENCESAAGDPFILRFTDDADSLLKSWEAEVESRLAEGGEMELFTDWGGKLVGATVRIAAVLHCVEFGPTGLVASQTVATAIEIARYLIPHADAALSLMEAKEDSVDDDAAYILRWIKRHGRKQFTKSEAQHHGKRRFPKADGIDKALEELVKRGYIRQKPSVPAGPGRPPSPSYEVNPSVFADTKPEKRSQNSRNPSESNDNGNSGNNGSASSQSEPMDREQVTI